MTFYLGTHQPSWLGAVEAPLCVSRARLAGRRSFPRAKSPWVLDSGAFSEIAAFGGWRIGTREYLAEVVRYVEAIGRPDWIAVQDWMCEPAMLAATGKTVAEHQERTLLSYLTLRWARPDLPWLPVLQGWSRADYCRHRRLYAREGIDLSRLPAVGVGSICRRQATREAERILTDHADLSLHAFGLKIGGMKRCQEQIESADSMAWSFDARRKAPLPGHEARHINCANCLEFALLWRDRLLSEIRPTAN